MKNWLQILRGETEGTSKEIANEIQDVVGQITDIEARVGGLREELTQAGISKLGGAEGTEKEIQKIEGNIRKLERDLLLFEEIKESLREKLAAAVQVEKNVRADEIQEEIKTIQAENKRMRE